MEPSIPAARARRRPVPMEAVKQHKIPKRCGNLWGFCEPRPVMGKAFNGSTGSLVAFTWHASIRRQSCDENELFSFCLVVHRSQDPLFSWLLLGTGCSLFVTKSLNSKHGFDQTSFLISASNFKHDSEPKEQTFHNEKSKYNIIHSQSDSRG